MTSSRLVHNELIKLGEGRVDDLEGLTDLLGGDDEWGSAMHVMSTEQGDETSVLKVLSEEVESSARLMHVE
jgi:hypothetical protein